MTRSGKLSILPLEEEDVPDPVPGEGQILVEMRAAGINFPDVLMIQDKYQFKPGLPFSPGNEMAGIVIGRGPGVSDVAIGDRVLVSVPTGGYAEKGVAEAARAIALPDEMGFEQACGYLMTYGTSYYALKDRAHIAPGETLLVLGAAGGVGLAAVDLGKAMGARVIAAASSEEKLAITRTYGADETILYPSGAMSRDQQKAFSDQIKALTGGKGADVIYDPVGGDYAEPALRAIAWEGRYLVIGFAAGDIPRIPLNLTLLKSCQIVGVFWGAFIAQFPAQNKANLEALTAMFRAGEIKPHISKSYPLSQAAQALRDMMDRSVTGNIVLVPG